MRLKRLAAVILALPLIHLNAARAAIACERHDDDAAMTEPTSHDAHAGHAVQAPQHERAMHELHGGYPDASPEHRPVDDSTSTECCQALASCSFAFGGAGGELLPGSFAAHIARPASVADTPPSRIHSPEPPPPKA